MFTLFVTVMTIKYLRIINSKGLAVYSENYSKSDPFFKEDNNDLEFIINNLYADLQLNYPGKLSLRRVDETPNLPKSLFVYFFIEHFDLFIFFSNQADLVDISGLTKLQNAINLRKAERSFFKGIVVSDFDDTQGPIPIFNRSSLEEDFLAILAVQGTTVLGMGMTTMPSNIVGPVPIPSNTELSTLIRGFQRPAPHSEDPRVQLGGRPTTIFIIIDSQITLHKESLDFIDTFLTQWIASEAVKEYLEDEDLKQMSIDLEQLLILSQDLIRLRDIQSSHLKELLIFYTTENMLLKQEIAHLRTRLSKKTTKASTKATTKKRRK